MPNDDITVIAPGYKNLETALDAGQIKSRLDGELHNYLGENIRLKKVIVTRAYPRPDRSFFIQYQIEIEDAEKSRVSKVYLFGHLFPSKEGINYPIEYAKNRTLMMKELNMAVPIFPYDPKLNNLARFMDSRKLGAILGPALNKYGKSANDISNINHEILGYRLKSRCILSYHVELGAITGEAGEKRTIIAKIYRPRRSQKAAKLIEFLRHSGFGTKPDNKLAVTKVLSTDPENDALFIEPGPGKSLHMLMTEPIFIDGCMAAASVLNRLQSSVNESLAVYTFKDELEKLGEKIGLFANVFPGMNMRLTANLKLLKDKSNLAEGSEVCCSHRDFYDKQVIYSTKMVTLIDCDNMAMADPALDCGNFLSQLRLRRIQYPQAAKIIGDGIEAFTGSLDMKSPGFADRIRWWQAATLLRILMLYSIRPRWREAIPEIWAELDKIWQE